MIGLIQIVAAKLAGRSGKWPALRKKTLAENPKCVACKRKATEIHHVIPVHVDRSLELDPNNLAAVCKTCHWSIGHPGSWSKWQEEFWYIVYLINRGVRPNA